MSADLGPEIRVLDGSLRHRFVGVALGAGVLLVSAGVAFAGHASRWPRLELLGGIGGVVGLLLVAIVIRSIGDRVTLHADGLVRRSKTLGDKSVRFDAITALRARPPAPAGLGAVEIVAGDALVTVDRAMVSELDSFVATLRERSGCELS